jgi:signal transduction histidine kinase
MDLLTPSPTNGTSFRLGATGDVLQVPPGASRLEIVYSALSLQLSERNNFKYQLEGADPGWVDAGSRRVAYYNKLPAGPYRFRVMASNNEGVWNDTPAELSFRVLPHVWNTLWFQAFTALAVTGALALAVRHVSIRNWRRKLAALQSLHEIERERARIARDIHDDLGARLTQITLLSDQSQSEPAGEARNSARKISTAARELAQSLDEIVWAVNPHHDTVEGLVEYLCQYADDYLEDTPLHCRLKRPDKLPSGIIPAESRHEFFLAFKEALHNAVKHGSASEIELEVAVEPGAFHVVLKDNGLGFDPVSAGTRGNGLKNMRGRLERHGGKFAVFSEPGQGARVTLSIPLQAVSPRL